ncbi:hypothetical protein [Nonomuraea sp. bgisy101]|uniref:hypothetical protein n=1 Tax=Nonomuraea sp. bgisy101 TaxID=3413784 RepID=UPI003D72B5AB
MSVTGCAPVMPRLATKAAPFPPDRQEAGGIAPKRRPIRRSQQRRRPAGTPGGHGPDPDLYTQRNTTERCIDRIKEWHGPAFRFDKTPDTYLAGLRLRGAILWIRSLQPA